MNFEGACSFFDAFSKPFRKPGANFVELRACEVRRIPLKRTSENPQKAKFAEYLFHALE
jgi:hypothetical protein